MADAEPTTNITPLRPVDPTNAERQRRHRAKKRKRTVTRTVTPKVPRTVTPTVTPSRSIATVTLLAAPALATCSAAFSISGLTSIFAGRVLGRHWPSTRNHSWVIRRFLKRRWRTFFLVQANGVAVSL